MNHGVSGVYGLGCFSPWNRICERRREDELETELWGSERVAGLIQKHDVTEWRCSVAWHEMQIHIGNTRPVLLYSVRFQPRWTFSIIERGKLLCINSNARVIASCFGPLT